MAIGLIYMVMGHGHEDLFVKNFQFKKLRSLHTSFSTGILYCLALLCLTYINGNQPIITSRLMTDQDNLIDLLHACWNLLEIWRRPAVGHAVRLSNPNSNPNLSLNQPRKSVSLTCFLIAASRLPAAYTCSMLIRTS